MQTGVVGLEMGREPGFDAGGQAFDRRAFTVPVIVHDVAQAEYGDSATLFEHLQGRGDFSLQAGGFLVDKKYIGFESGYR